MCLKTSIYLQHRPATQVSFALLYLPDGFYMWGGGGVSVCVCVFFPYNLFNNMLRYTVTLHVPVCLLMAK